MDNNNKNQQSLNEKDDDPAAANPMLYGPLHGARISKTNQYLATVILCLSAAAAGTGLSWTSSALPQLTSANSTLPITDDQGTWIASCLAIGALLGAIPAGILAERIGRKYAAILIGIPFIVSWLMTVFANSATTLYIARIIIGISTGGSCVVTPMFISELADTSIRGQLGVCFQLFLTIGILLVYVVGAITSWVNLSWICAALPAAFLIGLMFIPESPTWLLKNNRHDEAASSLKWFWGKYCDTNAAIQELQNALESAGGSASVRDLFAVTSNRNGFTISVMLMLFQQFSGINAVIFFTVPIFQSAGSTMDPNISTIIVGVVQVLACFASSVLVERAGRKILLLQSSALMAICLTVLGIYFKLKNSGNDVTNIGWIPLLSLVLFIVAFSLGYGPIPWMMMGELLAPEVKGIATSFVVLVNWICVFAVTKSFSFMMSSFGSDITFWIFAIIMVLGTLYGFKYVFETKGKSNAQIQLMLGDEK